jgi:molecular chaperone HscB
MDPFEILGLPRRYDVDLAAAEKTHRELSKALHPDKHAGGGATERKDSLNKAVAVNEAWRIVRDPIKRAESLFALLGIPVGEGKEPKADPEFLMDMMEQREALEDAKANKDAAALRALGQVIEDKQADAQRTLAEGFASGESAALTGKLGELRFYRRFLDEVSAVEDLLNG